MNGTTIPTVRIVGIVDGRGHLFCVGCADIVSFDDGFVWADSPPHSEEPCDICGELLNTK